MTKIKFRKNSKIVNTVSKILLLFFLLSFGTVKNLSAQFGGGDGLSEATAFQIWSKAHLDELRDSVNNGNNYSDTYFVVLDNIAEPITKPIGIFSYSALSRKTFQGVFDGNNKTIVLDLDYNLSAFGVGLFAAIENAIVKNVVVAGNVRGGTFVAGICAMAYTSLILNCINASTVVGNIAVAGILGADSVSTISNSINIGSIVSENGDCAGILACGSYGRSKILNCINYGYIRTISDDVPSWAGTGGIIGHHENSNIISNCANFGVVEGPEGLTGQISGTTVRRNITNCHYDKQMCGEED